MHPKILLKLASFVFPTSAILLTYLTASPAAHAQLVLSLAPSAQTGVAGDTLHFAGAVNNPTADFLFITGDSITFNTSEPGLTLDDSPFLVNAPTGLTAAGGQADTYTGGLFDVTINPSATAGTYFGTFEVLGGPESGTQATLAHADFSVIVTAPSQTVPVPEASTEASLGLLLALGLGGTLMTRRKVQRNTAASGA